LIDEKILTDSLREASEQHGDYETKLLSERDALWPAWYAAFLVGKHAELGSPATLTQLLAKAEKLFPGNDWPEKYAKYILENLE